APLAADLVAAGGGGLAPGRVVRQLQVGRASGPVGGQADVGGAAGGDAGRCPGGGAGAGARGAPRCAGGGGGGAGRRDRRAGALPRAAEAELGAVAAPGRRGDRGRGRRRGG